MNHALSSSLWQANEDLARACLNGPFVRGLGQGALPLPSFQSYVAQDAFFLETFARAYALALAHCKNRRHLSTLANLLAGALKELDLHQSYAARWDVDLSNLAPHPATLAYTDFLSATAAMESTGATCAAMAPCMRLYAFIGSALKKEFPDATHPYRDWIETYADPAFDALAARLESLLDESDCDIERAKSLYRRAMQLELNFFNAFAPAP